MWRISYYIRNTRVKLLMLIAAILVLGGAGYFIYYRLHLPVQYTVKPGTSIQSVLNRMKTGEICNLEPGVYHESLTVPRSGLTLRQAPRSKGEAVIDAGGAGNAIEINNVSDTVIQGLVVKNSADSLILISGTAAIHNVIRQNTLLEWGICGNWIYPAAIHLEQGCSQAVIDSNFMYRGPYEYIPGKNTIDYQSILFWGSRGYHNISNNIVVGVALDIDPSANLASFIQDLSHNVYTHAIKSVENFGDGYPYYRLNLGDGMSLNEKFIQSADFDETTFKGNHVFGAHDNLFEIQAADRDTSIVDNYIDCMGGAGAISLRSASIGPVYITGNTIVNFGTFALKYGGWDLGPGDAPKYISRNIFYSFLGRDFTNVPDWYTPVLNMDSYSRVLDGEVNGSNYNNVHLDNNYAYSRNAFLTLQPGSGSDNTFTNNHISTINRGYFAKWFSHSTTIDFAAFNSLSGGTNVWEVIPPPVESRIPRAGALR